MGFEELEEASRKRRQAERDERERQRILLDRMQGPLAPWAGAFVVAGACFTIAYAGGMRGVKGSWLMVLLGFLVIGMARWMTK